MIDNRTIEELLQRYKTNRAIPEDALTTLLICYIVMIAIGSIGNSLVCIAVIRKPCMRTPRNLFILNLAISDLTLCLITMPFTLIEIATKTWTLGKVACKLTAGLEATSIFVSAMSITAIARDRYQVIINPTQDSSQISHTIFVVIFIWVLAFLLSTPLLWYRTTCEVESPDLSRVLDRSITYCVEKWPIIHGRGIYSLFAIVVQYLLPVIIVVLSYLTIYHRLQVRMSQKRSVIKLNERIQAEEKRTRRANILLISISLIFCISWLPLNVLNVISDFKIFAVDDEPYRIVFAICHMICMSSACINPLLYGWLNDNFQKEFREIFSV